MSRVTRHRLVLVALLLCSFALRLWRLDGKGLWWDESLSLWRAEQSLGVILSNHIAVPGSITTDQHPPLYFALLRGVLLVGGSSDWSLRFPSVVWATLLVVLLYLMGTRLRNPRTGLLSALFGACSPFLLWYAQEARMYTMVAALGLAVFYALWCAFVDHRWAWAVGAVVLAVAAVGTQYLFGLALPCALGVAICLWPRRASTSTPAATASRPVKRRFSVAVYVGAAVLLVALALAAAWVWRLLPTLAAGRQYIGLSEMLLDALNAFSLGLSVERAQIWPLLIVFGGVYVAGVVSLWRHPPPTTSSRRASRWAGLILVLGYVLAPIVGMWLLSLFVPIYMGSRYVLLSSPAFYLGLGLGVEALGRKRRWPAWVVGVVLLGAMGLSTYNYFYVPRYAVKEDHRAAARAIAVAERVGDGIIVTAPENVTVFEHYYWGRCPVIPLPVRAMTGNPDPAELVRDLTEAIAPFDRVWLVHCRTEFSDPDNLVTQWLDTNLLLLQRRELPSWGSEVTLSAYQVQWPVQEYVEPPAGASEPVGEVGGVLALERYALRAHDVQGEVLQVSAVDQAEGRFLGETPPGAVIGVHLQWLVLQPLPNLRTSLRLVDEDGVIWSQSDADAYAYLPTSAWPVGASVRHEPDVRVLPGTPPGRYTLQLWVYGADDGQVKSYRERATGIETPWLNLGVVMVGGEMADPTGEAWPPQTATRVRWCSSFGRVLALQGYVLSPESIRPGGAVLLQLYWRALEQPQADYELVVDWRDGGQRVWHSSAHSLTGTDYPSTAWQPGQTLRGLLWLSIPEDVPPGELTLHLSVRDRADGSLLPVFHGPLRGMGYDLATARLQIE